jgi:hypothetical protein
MRLNISEFAALSKTVNNVRKLVKNATVTIDYNWVNGETKYYSKFSDLSFSSIDKAWEYLKIPNDQTSYIELGGLVMGTANPDHNSVAVEALSASPVIDAVVTHQNKLRFVPVSTPTDVRPQIIATPPPEFLEAGHTYRILSRTSVTTSKHIICTIAREDEPIYNYLDQYFFVHFVGKKSGDKPVRTVVSDQYDIHTAHIFCMLTLQPTLTELLRDECFIDSHTADILRLKMLKKLDTEAKERYASYSQLIDADYQKNTTLIAVNKLVSGEIEKTSLNNIVFTKDSASYENNVTVKYDGLMRMLSSSMNFNNEYDIYAVIQLLATQLQEKVNDAVIIDEEGVYRNIDEEGAYSEKLEINGIPISVSKHGSGERKINGIRINTDELAQVISRASCYRDADNYRKFVKSISKLSIQWHDIIANGLGMKIHSTITQEEYNTAAASKSAPVLRFVITKDRGICLKVDENRLVKVKMRKLISKIRTLNKQTNNVYNRRAWPLVTRSYRWCAQEVVKALIECTTFEEIVKHPETGQEQTQSVCHITKEDVAKLLETANAAKLEAIAKSREFMQMAVRLSKAEEIDFQGKKAYKVKGSLRTYAVVIDTAKVYDFDTKQYRCIVNDKHYAGAGYDDIAARLLALKNDSMMQTAITTLKGHANPAAEHVHDNQPGHIPDREASVSMQNVIDQAFQ